jgi:DNA topoisomerase-1
VSKYTLIVTEKPAVAMRIALAIDENRNPKRVSENGVPYYVAKRQKEILIVPSRGHLYTIIGTKKGRNYPAFAYKWAPRYVAEKNIVRIRTWIQTIARLARNADAFIDACDYDIEGCIIGYCILKYACGNMDRIAKRMKYSTLTRQDLKKAYSKLLPHLDSGLIQAGCASRKEREGI